MLTDGRSNNGGSASSHAQLRRDLRGTRSTALQPLVARFVQPETMELRLLRHGEMVRGHSVPIGAPHPPLCRPAGMQTHASGNFCRRALVQGSRTHGHLQPPHPRRVPATAALYLRGRSQLPNATQCIACCRARPHQHNRLQLVRRENQNQ